MVAARQVSKGEAPYHLRFSTTSHSSHLHEHSKNVYSHYDRTLSAAFVILVCQRALELQVSMDQVGQPCRPRFIHKLQPLVCCLLSSCADYEQYWAPEQQLCQTEVVHLV